MPARMNPTTRFVNLLEACVIEHNLFREDDLRFLLSSAKAYNPVDRCDLDVREKRHTLWHVMKQAFDKLVSDADLDWDEIKEQVRLVEERLEPQTNSRKEARRETRWMALEEPNEIFNYSEWASAWSGRNLERVLSFFSEDAEYLDETYGRRAEGKCNLRKLFATLFHTFDWKMKVITALRAPTADKDEVELQWERVGSRILAFEGEQSLGSGSVRGKSSLFVKTGGVCKCVDSWEMEDIERIALNRLGFNKPKTPGMISTTDTEVSVDRIRLLKVLKLKTSIPDPETGARGTDG